MNSSDSEDSSASTSACSDEDLQTEDEYKDLELRHSFLRGVIGFGNELGGEIDDARPGCSGLNRSKRPLSSDRETIQNGHVSKRARTEQLSKKATSEDTVGTLLTDALHSIIKLQENIQGPKLKLPVPKKLKEHNWLIENQQRLILGQSGVSYTGDIIDGKMNGFGKLNLDQNEYIEGKWRMNRLIEVNSSQLILGPEKITWLIVKRQNDHLMYFYEKPYVARVALHSTERLDFTTCLACLKRKFIGLVKVLEVLVEDMEHRSKEAFGVFETQLKIAINTCTDTVAFANTLNILRLYLGKIGNDIIDILNDSNLPENVKMAAPELLHCFNHYSNKSKFSEDVIKMNLNLKETIIKVHFEGIVLHEKMVRAKCPKNLPTLLSSILNLPPSKRFYVIEEDLRVFDHLVSLPCFVHYPHFFDDLAQRFCSSIDSVPIHTPPPQVVPVMSPISGYIMKSFWEIISEILEVVPGYDYKDMLKCEFGEWKPLSDIKWPELGLSDSQRGEFFQPLYYRALEAQYKFLLRMTKYFCPGKYNGNKKHHFKFSMLDLACLGSGDGRIQELTERLENTTSERFVWLALLLQTINEVFKDDIVLLKPYNALLQGQISLIENSSTESHETFRLVTHSVVKFITSTAPYFREAQERSGIDVEILVQQIWTFSTASQEMMNDPSSYSSFRDLIAEYNRYLSLRLFINIDASSGYFSNQISGLMQKFMSIVATSLKKKVPTTVLVVYLRSFNDFLDDLKNIDFLALWYVKHQSYCPDVTVKVKNKLSEGGNCSYRVVDVEKYVLKMPKNQFVPHHYIILVVAELLGCIEECLEKNWQSGDEDPQVTQLKCTGLMLDAVRRSFMYLKEQPDYVDFETFKKESVELFVRLVNDCNTWSDLKKRSSKVGESFWYIRKMDEVGIEETMKMFQETNRCDMNKLFKCYNFYLAKYDSYIGEYVSLVSNGKSHTEGLNTVIQMLDKAKPAHFSTWTDEFKSTKIPVMLAGLCAVWSILVSKDVSNSGKLLKPHCIQIICILRLLSVDQPTIPVNHLAEVFTGQGKSVILGLLSALLAMTGHSVTVLCYSDYLSTRDQESFDEFFKVFHLTGKIGYSTFSRMASSLLRPFVNNKKSSLSQLVVERLRNHTNWSRMVSAPAVPCDSVLIIDEVDVFFSDSFYGSEQFFVASCGSEGLALLQERVWDLVNEKHSKEQIFLLSTEFINSQVAAGDRAFVEFNGFINRKGTFSMLTREKCVITTKQYTNRELFEEHLKLMISIALSVKFYYSVTSEYMLDSAGFICRSGSDGVFTRHAYDSYFNTFHYFRLKKSNFEHLNYKNYGYFILQAGAISYARLPLEFKLILGVSGTLRDLGSYEKSWIQSFNIHNFSTIPSFFGTTNLKFDDLFHFHYCKNLTLWMKAIYDRANHMVVSRRAVLVFFESERVMETFSKEYNLKFDRLHKLTESTPPDLRDAYIEEAGLPCTVTLATRRMGRGVDYKSSLSVEKNGGIHVIQTFFSLDAKEEVQIKGRTARKENKGSYELFVCEDHLVEKAMVTKGNRHIISYWDLVGIREELSDKKGSTIEQNLKRSEANHVTTMKFFGLI